MVVIIAGSRDITDYKIVVKAIRESGFTITKILQGAARGVDTLAREYAIKNQIDYEEFPAKWKLHGKIAGFIRNQEMADKGEALIAVWDGQSRGTADMIARAKKKGIPVFIFYVFAEQKLDGLFETV